MLAGAGSTESFSLVEWSDVTDAVLAQLYNDAERFESGLFKFDATDEIDLVGDAAGVPMADCEPETGGVEDGGGVTGEGKASRGEAGRGEADRGEADRGEASRGEAGRGEADRGEADRGEADRGEAGRGEAGGVEAGGGETGSGGGSGEYESDCGVVTRLVSSMVGIVPEVLEIPEVLNVPEVDLVGLVVTDSKFGTDITEADEALEPEEPEAPEMDLVELVETDRTLETETTEADEALVTGDAQPETETVGFFLVRDADDVVLGGLVVTTFE